MQIDREVHQNTPEHLPHRMTDQCVGFELHDKPDGLTVQMSDSISMQTKSDDADEL